MHHERATKCMWNFIIMIGCIKNYLNKWQSGIMNRTVASCSRSPPITQSAAKIHHPHRDSNLRPPERKACATPTTPTHHNIQPAVTNRGLQMTGHECQQCMKLYWSPLHHGKGRCLFRFISTTEVWTNTLIASRVLFNFARISLNSSKKETNFNFNSQFHWIPCVQLISSKEITQIKSFIFLTTIWVWNMINIYIS